MKTTGTDKRTKTTDNQRVILIDALDDTRKDERGAPLEPFAVRFYDINGGLRKRGYMLPDVHVLSPAGIEKARALRAALGAK